MLQNVHNQSGINEVNVTSTTRTAADAMTTAEEDWSRLVHSATHSISLRQQHHHRYPRQPKGELLHEAPCWLAGWGVFLRD